MITVSDQLAIWGAVLIFTGGGAYYDIRRRVVNLEKSDREFLRRDEANILIRQAEETHERQEGRLNFLETRLRDVEARTPRSK